MEVLTVFMKGCWKYWVPEPDPGFVRRRKIPIGSRKVRKVFLRVLPAALVFILFISFIPGYPQERPPRVGPGDPEIREFIRLVNARRRSIGCPELKWDDRIAAVAQRHSRDMVSRNFYSHTNPDGKDPFDRLEEADIDFSAAAENIALGPKTGKEAYEIWQNSPSHRRNMLNCRYTRQGVGRARSRWTQVLIRPLKKSESIPGLTYSATPIQY
jgi:hypothetical protein